MIAVDRRRFVVIVGGLLIAPGAFAQLLAGGSQLIGILHHGTRADSESELTALREGLREAGFVEGRNLRIEYRFAEYDYLKLERLAEDLVSADVQVIYAPTTWTVRAARTATKTVPIVFSGVNDPVPHRFVQSLARPGGNITGISLASAELTAKRVQLMRELFPATDRLGVVYDKDAARECGIELREIGAAGKQLGVQMQPFPYNAKADLADVFEQARRANIPGLLIPTTYETRRFGAGLAMQASATRIPLIHAGSDAVEAGGLISYGPSHEWAWRRAANYIVRILNGAKPSDLPVERPTKYELVINLKTARAMGITIPQSVLLRADRVIE
jgi:putative ABC transport system substrate-binding protein